MEEGFVDKETQKALDAMQSSINDLDLALQNTRPALFTGVVNMISDGGKKGTVKDDAGIPYAFGPGTAIHRVSCHLDEHENEVAKMFGRIKKPTPMREGDKVVFTIDASHWVSQMGTYERGPVKRSASPPSKPRFINRPPQVRGTPRRLLAC